MNSARWIGASLLVLALGCATESASSAPAGAPGSAPKSGEQRVLAVLELKNKLAGAEASAIDSTYLSNVIRSHAVEQVPGLKVITRENMLVLVQASGKSLAECEGECEVDTGRLLGADLVISGELLKFGTHYKLDLRLHDTREGRLLAGAHASGRSADELDEEVSAALNKLMAPLAAQRPPPAAPSNAPAAPTASPAPATAAAPVYSSGSGSGPVGVPVSPIPPGPFVPASADEILGIKCQSSTACFELKACQADRKKCGQGGIGFGYLQGAWDMPKDQRLGVGGYFMSCDAGNGLDCWFLAIKFDQGDGIPADKKRAMALHRRGCELGEVHACTSFRESAKRADREFVDDVLERLCRQENRDACSARVVVQPPPGTSMERGTLGWALYTPCGSSTHCGLQKLCRESRDKCGMLASGYDHGQFELDTDKALAFTLYSAACDAGDQNACYSVAQAYGDGSGVPKDPKQQLATLRKTCASGLAPACFTIVNMKALPAEKSWAKEQIVKQCAEGDSIACSYRDSMKK